jgi:hypothetical protein
MFFCLFALSFTCHAGLYSSACAHAQKYNRYSSDTLDYCRKAAQAGDAYSQYVLGKMYFRGSSIAKSELAGVEHWIKAAKQGNKDAQRNLARLYETGRILDKDHRKAFYWYLKASAQQDPYAIHRLGVLFQNGLGTRQDYRLAKNLYKKSARLGLAESYYNMAVMEFLGEGGKPDSAQAYSYMLVAAEMDYRPATIDINTLSKQLSEREINDASRAVRALHNLATATAKPVRVFFSEEFNGKNNIFPYGPVDIISSLKFRRSIHSADYNSEMIPEALLSVTQSLNHFLAHKNWLRVVVNIEVSVANANEPTSNTIALYIGETSNREFYLSHFEINRATKAAFFELHKATKKRKYISWRACEFILDNDGGLTIHYITNGPSRLMGERDKENYLRYSKEYLDTYLKNEIIYGKNLSEESATFFQ